MPAILGRFRSSVEAIADPGLRGNVLRMLRIRFDLFSKVLDKDPKVIHLIAVIGPPDRLQQFAMRNRLVRVLRQIAEKIEFFGRQMRTPACDRHAARRKVDFESAGADFRGGRLGGWDSAESCPY